MPIEDVLQELLSGLKALGAGLTALEAGQKALEAGQKALQQSLVSLEAAVHTLQAVSAGELPSTLFHACLSLGHAGLPGPACGTAIQVADASTATESFFIATAGHVLPSTWQAGPFTLNIASDARCTFALNLRPHEVHWNPTDAEAVLLPLPVAALGILQVVPLRANLQAGMKPPGVKICMVAITRTGMAVSHGHLDRTLASRDIKAAADNGEGEFVTEAAEKAKWQEGRIASCSARYLCHYPSHRGMSGAGIFTADGTLVGVHLEHHVWARNVPQPSWSPIQIAASAAQSTRYTVVAPISSYHAALSHTTSRDHAAFAQRQAPEVVAVTEETGAQRTGIPQRSRWFQSPLW